MVDDRFVQNRATRASARAPGLASGFTLIELMITVAIVAILVSLAISSYRFAMVKTRRGAAEGCLLEDAQYMERFYTTNFTYVGAVPPNCKSDVTNYYATAPTATIPDAKTYTLSLAPSGSQASADAKCGTLGVDQTGTKTVTGTANVSDCW